MKTDDMLRQAKATLDNITELAARLTALEREFTAASEALEDGCLRMAKSLRIELGECPLEDITVAVELTSVRRRELEVGLRHVLQTLIDPRFPDVALGEARIELERLVGETDARETHPQKDLP